MEPHLLQLVAHVTSARVMQRKWEAGELSSLSVITYPDRLVEVRLVLLAGIVYMLTAHRPWVLVASLVMTACTLVEVGLVLLPGSIIRISCSKLAPVCAIVCMC